MLTVVGVEAIEEILLNLLLENPGLDQRLPGQLEHAAGADSQVGTVVRDADLEHPLGVALGQDRDVVPTPHSFSVREAGAVRVAECGMSVAAIAGR